MNYEWIRKTIQRTKPTFFPQSIFEVFLFQKLCDALKRSIKHQRVYDSGQCKRSTVNGTQPVKIKAQKRKDKRLFQRRSQVWITDVTRQRRFFLGIGFQTSTRREDLVFLLFSTFTSRSSREVSEVTSCALFPG